MNYYNAGANVDAEILDGLTALVYALKAKNNEIVDLIKNAGGSY